MLQRNTKYLTMFLVAWLTMGFSSTILGADTLRHSTNYDKHRAYTGTEDQLYRKVFALAPLAESRSSDLLTGLYFDQSAIASCCIPGLPQTIRLALSNRTDSPGLVQLAYGVDSRQGFITGPESVYLGAWDTAAIEVTLVTDPALPSGQTVRASIHAFGPGLTAATDIQGLTATAVWELAPTEPNTGRMDNVVAVYNGMIWSVTGWGSYREVSVLNPDTDTWSVIPLSRPPFGVGIDRARSGAVHGSKVYMYGDAATAGFTGLWSYNMATNVWLNEAPGGTPPPYSGIWTPAWATDPETGLFYITGGATTPGGGNLNTVYVYNPVTNAWLAPLPNFTTVRDHHAAFIFRRPSDGHKLLCVAGGATSYFTYLTSTQCYDFNTGTWNAENADVPHLPFDWWGMGYCQLECRPPQLWLVGGVTNGTATIHNYSYYHEVGTDTWVSGGTFPSPAAYRLNVAVLDGTIYKLGGSTGGFTPTGTASRITPPCSTYDLIFVDDHGRSKLCISSDTGDYVYHVLTGTGAGEYSGTGVFKTYNYGYYFHNQDGNPWLVYVNHATNINRATGYLKWGAKRINSVLYDRLTTDNPEDCD